MTMSVRFCLLYDSLTLLHSGKPKLFGFSECKRVKIEFNCLQMNIISIRKSIADTVIVNDDPVTMLLHMWSYDFYDNIVH